MLLRHAFVLCVLAASIAQADPLNHGLDVGTSTSGSYEARNVFVQPAALAFDTSLNGPELSSTMALATDPTAKNDFNFGVAWGYLGFGAERFTVAGWSRYSFAAAVPIHPTLFLGTRLGLYRYDNGTGTESWDFGLQYRPSRYFSVGFLFNQLNQPVLAGSTLPVLSTASLTLRPVDRIELTADVTTPSNAFFRTASAQATVGWQFANGLRARVGYHTTYQWFAGVQLHFGNASAFGSMAPQAARKFIVGLQSVSTPYASAAAPAKKVKMTVGGALSDEKFAGGWLVGARPSLLDLIQDLESLEKDSSVRGIVLRIDGFPLGLASAGELHQAILRFRRTGKTVEAFLGEAGIKEYVVASAADKIYLEPAGQIRWLGLRSEHYFLKGTLDKIGVQGEFLAAGKYKAAPEMFTRKESSDIARAALKEEMKALEASVIELLGKSPRKVTAAKWKDLLELGLLSAEEAKETGLVDGLASYSTLLSDAKKKDWIVPFSELRKDFLRLPPRVSVVVASGNILPDRARWLALGDSQATPYSMQKKLEAASGDPRTRAIVLRVSSPGGEVLASQQIATNLENTASQSQIPVTVSMGDVAASGGYYISAPARRIFAGELTLTGSIGVFLGKFSLNGLFHFLDLHKEIVTEGPYPGLYSEDRPWTKAERAVMERRLQSYYDGFIGYVARGRKMDRAKVADAAQGRVWTGTQAKKVGLVDEIGGYYEALRSAATDAGLSEGEYEIHEVEASLGLLGLFGDEAWSKARSFVDKSDPVSYLLTPKLLQELLWVSTMRDSPFLYLSPVRTPDA